MPLQIIHRDITTIKCDAIVNPTDRFYSGGGGTDAQIHRGAGSEMDEACSRLKPLEVGEVEVTPGFGLPTKQVIHTVGPVWKNGVENETMLLRSCYMNALVKAKRMGCGSIAFPLISSGTFGFPKDRVLRIAIDAISDFLFTVDEDIDVYVCVYNRNSFELSKEIALKEYLSRSKRFIYEDHALKMERQEDEVSEPEPEEDGFFASEPEEDYYYSNACISAPSPDYDEEPPMLCGMPAPAPKLSLDEILKQHDDTFAVLLFKLIDLKKMDDVECYKKANVSKNIFYRIRNDGKYHPSKPTVIAFAIALELTIDDTEKLLRSAGYAFAGNNDFDLIIRFYIEQGVYDVFEINEALYKYDQVPLGC